MPKTLAPPPRTAARPIAIAALVALTGCGQMMGGFTRTEPRPVDARAVRPPTPEVALPETEAEIVEVVAEAGRSEARPAGARTAEQFDTTTEEERAVAVAAADAPSEAEEERLGTAIVSLGDPTDPGLWLQTDLVSANRPGRLVNPGTGDAVLVELRPIEAGAGGARISLPALRLLNAPLTSLPEIEIFAR